MKKSQAKPKFPAALMFLWLLGPALASASQITSIDFKGTQDPNQILIQADGPVTYEKQDNAQDKQVILDIKGATLAKGASRKLDTSSFNGKVSLISPYKTDGETVRVVIQLRENTDVQVAQNGNVIQVSVPGGASSAAGGTTTDPAPAVPGAPDMPPPPADSASAPAPAPDAPAAPGSESVAIDHGTHTTAASAAATQAKLDEFLQNSANKHFTGSPISLQIRDADLTDVFRLIGEASGFNIVMGDEVRGKITLSLEDAPWDQVLDVVLRTNHLGAERSNNLLRISTLTNLTKEKNEQFAEQEASAKVAPRITRIFPISYADLGDLARILTTFSGGSIPATGAAAGAAPSIALPVGGVPPQNGVLATTATVQPDKRTNSLIVRDLPENVDRMKKLIEILDTQTPQILIEAKIIEATESFSHAMSGSLGFSQIGNGIMDVATGFNTGSAIGGLFGVPGSYADGPTFAGASKNGSTAGISFNPSLSFLPGNLVLNAVLSYNESENNVKVVASPKTVVLDRETANILESTPVLVPGAPILAGGATTPVATTSVQQANLSLKVTPSVTNEGSVLLTLDVQRAIPFNLTPDGSEQAVADRSMTTKVLVDSGSTLVIGGIYTNATSDSSSGIPFLRKIPIIGKLFGSESHATQRSELFFFVTPRILNPKEAGLAS